MTETDTIQEERISLLEKELAKKKRELQVEAALQRVLDKTVAMKSSRDIADATATFFDELVNLGVGTSMRGGISIFYESGNIDLWTATTVTDGEVKLVVGKITRHIHPLLENTFTAWQKGDETFSIELKEDDLRSFYKSLNDTPQYPYKFDLAHLPKRRINNTFFFPEGALYAYTDDPLPENAIQLVKRFANAFSLTYRRYLDLKRIEDQSAEATKGAAIDRVRAETASMRTANDLERITPLLWTVLQTLEVPFIRCGVFIMSEEQQLLRAYLSTPDGKAIASFHASFADSNQFSEIIIHWRKKEIYRQYWDEDTFAAWTKSLIKHGFIKTPEEFTKSGAAISLYLHFIPFAQGMLYVGSTVSLDEDTLLLVQNLADAFSSAYARYEDFVKLEAANEKLETTLSELKTTQAQLIQSEKMASLGELTAGIAHEIQNPLNFINNFSEINNELIEEMNREADLEEIKNIALTISQNNEKIAHHGKRADAIVKSMLLHSRQNKGVKEMTDINALCDEYLRLSYHGLRAKDKSFNADFKSDFDSSAGNVLMVPQDIGRVLLNLFNNAFYAANEKKKQLAGYGYQPLVTVATKRIKDKIQITVTDNGNGISQNITDKIFQPFFTTKPTGSGTGLGLSLAYDIITKEHRGSISVESQENSYTRFTITLPL